MGEINIPLRETHTIGVGTRELIVSAVPDSLPRPLSFTLAGITDAAAGFLFVRRHPPFGHILACVAGSGEVWGENGWAPLGPDRAYVTPSQISHAYRAVPGQTWRLCWLHLPAATPMPSPMPQIVTLDARPLEASVEGLYWEAMGSADASLLHHWASLVQHYVDRALGGQEGDLRLRPLWKAVDGDLAHPWTVASLAARAGLSGEHLRRLCRRQWGHSPMQHVTELRMRRAAALLSSGFRTVESVAPQVGYENPFAFSTAFKRWLGLPPSQYRDRLRSGGG